MHIGSQLLLNEQTNAVDHSPKDLELSKAK